MGDNDFQDQKGTKAISKQPIDWASLGITEQIRNLRFFRDKDNHIVVLPVVMFDPTGTPYVLPLGKVGISDPQAQTSYARVYGLPGGGYDKSTVGLIVQAMNFVYNNAATGKEYEAVRTPTIFSFVGEIQAAGNTALWTPAAGKKFRVLGGIICCFKESTSGANAMYIRLRDGAAGAYFFTVQVCHVSLTASNMPWSYPIALTQNGFIASAINNVLEVTLDNAFTAGGASVQVWGCEE